jgi:glycerol-3-phosphate dehydrogenase (NAD(P)+)
MANISVLGAGSWGSALAMTLARSGHDVLLFSHNVAHVAQMQAERENRRYLPQMIFPAQLHVTADLSYAMNFARTILIAVPSHAFNDILQSISTYWTPSHELIWATKGLAESGDLLHTLIEKQLGKEVSKALLSGPSFALEVAQGLPTAVALISDDIVYAEKMAQMFNHGHFRAYIGTDIIGAQLGGAVKNVLAIATGISDGLGFGANARSALITRGLAEMMRLGQALSASRETFMGLTGVGDLVLTCTDNQSRNRRYGLALGQGEAQDEIAQRIGQVVEGVLTSHHVYSLAKKYDVDMPITEQVYRVVSHDLSPKEAVITLLNRALKVE